MRFWLCSLTSTEIYTTSKGGHLLTWWRMTSKDRWLLNISIWCYIRPTWRQYQNMCQNFTSDQLQVLSISIHWLSVNKTPQNNSNATIKLIYTEPANSVCRQRLLQPLSLNSSLTRQGDMYKCTIEQKLKAVITKPQATLLPLSCVVP